MADYQNLREHLLWLLEGGAAHATTEQALDNFPVEYVGVKPPRFPHTAWQILEHMRVMQWDTLEFMLKPEHISPKFPLGYWPQFAKPKDRQEWERTVDNFHRDLSAILDLVKNPGIDLLEPIPHGSGQTYLREILLVTDHNAYHLGQIVTLRRTLNIWL
jgi:hypothetical protein